MLNIRLVRTGRKRDAHYRVVVSDSARLGRVVETLGSYHPRGGAPMDFEEGANRRLDLGRVRYWLGCGAQPSPTVRSFLKGVSLDASTGESPAGDPGETPAESPAEIPAEAPGESPAESPAESGEAPASEPPGA